MAALLSGLSTVFAERLNVAVEPPRVPDSYVQTVTPGRDSPLRIIALRVEFIPDTLSTTTGDGSFNYVENDTNYYDPPPHDSLYFADNLRFLRFYWSEMSGGALDIDTSWAIYPPGERAAYRLPKQMWQYNWNSSDEQLNLGLAELFRDAVTVADESSLIDWSAYDLVIVFHAGAGAEFTIGFGFDSTPHDIPSAWMVEQDFRDYLDLPYGIPVGDGAEYVTGGLILPETETRQGVQISMLGIMCSLFGHWLGLPGLYDSDDGAPVVGKWSLMDRGFGNYFGAIPAELDAWSRYNQGWLSPEEVTAGDLVIRSRLTDTAGVPEAYRVSISDREYFLLECRNRDPERDSIAHAWDRIGNMMTFHEDYSVDFDPGFRVPVRIDNLDFDSPGSGILIWHVDEALEPLISGNRFNAVNERRGLDLEEADGAQDIGQDYPFLTPGWGTDYGIFPDAWYGDNKAHQEANQGRAVSFNDHSFPNSRANSTASTHITLDNFSLVDTVMEFSFKRDRNQDGFPKGVAMGWDTYLVGNFDSDPFSEIFLFDSYNSFKVYDGDGSFHFNISTTGRHIAALNSFRSRPAAADFNDDGKDDIILNLKLIDNQGWVLAVLISDGIGYYDYTLNEIYHYTPDSSLIDCQIVVGGESGNQKFLTFGIISTNDGHKNFTRIFDNDFNLIGEYYPDVWYNLDMTGGFLLGTDNSDTFMIANAPEVIILHDDEVLMHESPPQPLRWCSSLADYDGSGYQDLTYITNSDPLSIFPFGDLQLVMIKDIAVNHFADYTVMEILPSSLGRDHGIPADYDHDNRLELLVNVFGLSALEINGKFSEGSPLDIAKDTSVRYGFPVQALFCADIDNDQRIEILTVQSTITEGSDTFSEDIWLNVVSSSGRKIPGHPVSLSLNRSVASNSNFPGELCQLDDDENLEFVYLSENAVNVIEIPATDPTIWWGSRYRDNRNRNAVWEPATPFTPAAGSSIMPVDLCYNWPNPASGETFIRYFLNEPAVVKVDVFDLTGERVTTLYGPGEAGLHHEILWDLEGIHRGAYFAMVEAKGSSGTETKLVKIAVR